MAQTPEIRTELDDYGRDALLRLIKHSRDRAAADELRRKAHDELVAFLEAREADVGTLNGNDVCSRIRYPRETIDTAALRQDEPFMFRKYGRVTWVTRLDVARHATSSVEALIEIVTAP
jgi:hypothetical protein